MPTPTPIPLSVNTARGTGSQTYRSPNLFFNQLTEVRLQTIQPGRVSVGATDIDGNFTQIWANEATPFDKSFIYRTGAVSDDFTIAAQGAIFHITTGSVANRAVDIERFKWTFTTTQQLGYDRDTSGDFELQGVGQDFSREIWLVAPNSRVTIRHDGASFFRAELMSAFGNKPDYVIHTDHLQNGPGSWSFSIPQVDIGDYILRVRTDPGNNWRVTID